LKAFFNLRYLRFSLPNNKRKFAHFNKRIKCNIIT
jgi:hypothetical protein